jgi:hypothetical protein
LKIISYAIPAKTLCDDFGLDDMYTSLLGWKHRPLFISIQLLISGKVCDYYAGPMVAQLKSLIHLSFSM